MGVLGLSTSRRVIAEKPRPLPPRDQATMQVMSRVGGILPPTEQRLEGVELGTTIPTVSVTEPANNAE